MEKNALCSMETQKINYFSIKAVGETPKDIFS
jgi:hypothetical protein